MAFGRIAPDDERVWWYEQAGVEPVQATADREIPVLKDAAAAGTPRAINDKEIDYTIKLPKNVIPAGGKLVGIPIEGDSMSPILETGYIAFIDATPRSLEKMAGKMVAARDSDGVTVKWLRKQSKDLYLLVPQHTSPRHQVQVVQKDGDWSIVGEVITWIGFPPPLRK